LRFGNGQPELDRTPIDIFVGEYVPGMMEADRGVHVNLLDRPTIRHRIVLH
jgi:hypothetical protein